MEKQKFARNVYGLGHFHQFVFSLEPLQEIFSLNNIAFQRTQHLMMDKSVNCFQHLGLLLFHLQLLSVRDVSEVQYLALRIVIAYIHVDSLHKQHLVDWYGVVDQGSHDVDFHFSILQLNRIFNYLLER